MTQALHSVASRPGVRMTYEEFLAFEERADERHLFLEGQVVAMSGGSAEQSAIIVNLMALAHAALSGSPCRLYESNLAVKYGRRERYGYTDGMIVCGEPRFKPHPQDKRITLLNPTVVFEVLSDSTREFDRTEKFDYYREIESLREYVLIEQSRPRVDVYFRAEDGTWRFAAYTSLEQAVGLESVRVELPMRSLYANVAFPPRPPETPEQPQP